MKIEDIEKQFIDSIISAVLLSARVESPFLNGKIILKIENLLRSYRSFITATSEDKESVAQYHAISDMANSIDGLIELYGYLEYMDSIPADSPLFPNVLKNLLGLKLEFIRLRKNTTTSFKNNQKLMKPADKLKDDDKSAPGVNKVKDQHKLNSSQEKILNYIKSYPDKRTKDIIYEFNIFSDRTVKRNLMELVRAGLVNKKTGNKATYYSASS